MLVSYYLHKTTYSLTLLFELMFRFIAKLSGLLFILFALTYCSESEDIPGSPPNVDPGTYSPTPVGNTIVLDGSNTSDPDGDPLTYTWSMVEVPENSTITTNDIGDSNRDRAFFTPDIDGDYTVSLSVSDGFHPTVTEEAIITVTPPVGSPPEANAGADQTVNVNTTVNLDGSASSDPDGDALTYNWAIASNPVGNTATITDKDKEKASFQPDKTGNYVIELTVTDETGKSDKDNVTITVN